MVTGYKLFKNQLYIHILAMNYWILNFLSTICNISKMIRKNLNEI